MMNMIHVTFVMEQHVGLYTYYQNLRRFIDSEANIEATWVPVTYFKLDGFWERMTFLPERVRGALRGRAQVRRSIAQTTSDVLFFNTQVPAALAHGMVHRRPYLISTDVTAVQFDQLRGEYGLRARRAGPVKTYKHFANTRVLRGATRLLPWSRWVANSLVADYGVDPQKIEVVPPGVDLTQWLPGCRETEGPVKVLFVGGDLKRKGGLLLLEAFRAVRPLGVELHLVTRDKLPEEPGLFVYNNMQPNSDPLKQLFRTCDIFCLPTQADCLPMVLSEAGATGLPMIATNVAAIPEIVREGETGFLIEPGDVAGLIERLQLLASDPALRKRMGRAARQHVETNFDARRNGERMVGYLLEAAGATNEAQVM
jgi:glycosyltransferase involved in cell wall biosynthesis